MSLASSKQPARHQPVPIPPASAAWRFNFNLRESQPLPDTTGFSRVVIQLQPTRIATARRHHRLQPGGDSIQTYEITHAPDTTSFRTAFNEDTCGGARPKFAHCPRLNL
ncbi:MAG: hypothetical protein WAV20_11220, partial [Blastocatellia bacterium]